uniref:Putative methyltransferase At1g78140ic n=1 Tax=Rhizophora mucronata TaxID=61149 RepID=A0A2P2JKM5_RHIMU
MASSMTMSGFASSAFFPSQLAYSNLLSMKPYAAPFFKLPFAAKAVRASSAALLKADPTDPIVIEKESSSSTKNILACPVCMDRLSSIGDHVFLSVDSARGSNLVCKTCKKSYSGKETHLELIAASGAKKYGDAMPIATEFFRLPLMSFIYERGWRQNFVWGGFPGPEKEFELMKDYLNPVLGGNIVDSSCGSGLFSRLFAKSGLFSLVVALDYSEGMLSQCYEFIKQEKSFPKENLILVRADVSRLPFVSGSVDAVHAGCAIHCWPSPSTAVAEICRVLRPGGVFVASTYIFDGPFNFFPFLGLLRQNFAQISGFQFFLSERELEDICTACGLVGFACTRNRQFVMFSATKPS